VEDGNLTSTIQWVLHTELTVPEPVDEVWCVFRDIAGWYTEYKFETISGPGYQKGVGLLEGQVLKVTPATPLPRASHVDQTDGADYYVHNTIKVGAREIVVVLSGAAFDLRQYTSFYVWKVMEDDRGATVLVDTYGEGHLSAPLAQEEARNYQERLASNWQRSWADAFANFRKALAERRLREPDTRRGVTG
jgi:hypothetical protein